MQTFIDVNAFLSLQASSTCETLLFRSCKINQLESADGHVVLHLNVLGFNGQREDTVTSAGEFVKIMRS